MFATRMTGLRPKTSANVPQKGIEEALASRYADPVHAYSESGMWKDSDMVGRAVGISTVSRATRKIDMQRAVNARITERGGLEVVGGAVPVVPLQIEDVDNFSMTSLSGLCLDFVISTVDSRVSDVCRDDRSEGMPVLPAFSGSSLEADVEFGGAEA